MDKEVLKIKIYCNVFAEQTLSTSFSSLVQHNSDLTAFVYYVNDFILGVISSSSADFIL